MASQNGGNAGTNLYGTIYGNRGSWLTILAVLPGNTVAADESSLKADCLTESIFTQADLGRTARERRQASRRRDGQSAGGLGRPDGAAELVLIREH